MALPPLGKGRLRRKIVLPETRFMLIAKLINTKVMKYFELNNKNLNPPLAPPACRRHARLRRSGGHACALSSTPLFFSGA